MRRLFIILSFFVFLSIFADTVFAAGDDEIFNAKVLEVESVVEHDGLRMQTIKCEILEGDYRGSIRDILVPLENDFSRPVKVGDRIKINVVEIGEEQYFQFYDFARSRNYIWLFGLFTILLLVFVGWKGAKTLIPSFLLVLLLLIGAVPDLLSSVGFLVGSILVIFILTAVTTWIRIRHKLLTIIVPFSVVLSLLLAFLVFVGFSQTAYVVPFIGSVTIVEEDLYAHVLDLMLVSVIFIPSGAVINASIQIAKYLMEEFDKKKAFSIGEMLKEGIRISQKICAGELNNLIMLMVGISLSGIYLIKEQFPNLNFWDNGWISLQVIYTISAGLSILLISPITIFITAAVIALSKGKAALGGQRRFKIMK